MTSTTGETSQTLDRGLTVLSPSPDVAAMVTAADAASRLSGHHGESPALQP